MLLRHRTTGDEVRAELKGETFHLESGEQVSARSVLQTHEIAAATLDERAEVYFNLSGAVPEYHRPPGPRGVSRALDAPGCLLRFGWRGLQVLLLFISVAGPCVAILDWAAAKTMGRPASGPDWSVMMLPPILWAVVASMELIAVAVKRAPTGFFTLRQRASAAAQIRERLLVGEGPERPFALYLRSFLTSGRLARENEGRIEEFETCLTETLELAWKLPLVSIGKAGDKFGSGRIPLETSEWQAFVELAIRHAQVVFIVPGKTEGTLWELQRLATPKAVRKTVVVMPPRSEFLDMKPWWEDVRAVSRDFILPPYSPAGRFLQFGRTGRVSASSAIPEEWEVFELQRSLETFLGPGSP